MIKRQIFFISLFLLPLSLFAQRGGESMYGILHLTQSARMATLGGNQVGIVDEDVSMLLHNPAMLDSVWSKQLTFSYVPYVADIHYGFAGFASDLERYGNIALGVYHIDYGSFVGTDENGLKTGEFGAGETALQLTYSYKLLDNLKVGVSVKPLSSRIESYSSFALASDVGLFYHKPEKQFSMGIVLRNYGKQLTSYSSAELETIRPDLQIGVSKKLEHAPFRFSITAQDLLSGSLSYQIYDDEKNIIIKHDDALESKIIRHFVLGLEFVPTKNFYVGGGVNPRRRQELKVDSKSSTVGYSWGFGIKIYKINIAYASTRYHLAGTSNYFTLSANLSSFK